MTWPACAPEHRVLLCLVCLRLPCGSRPVAQQPLHHAAQPSRPAKGEYPLAATIAAESSTKKNRGSLVAAVFSMQAFRTECITALEPKISKHVNVNSPRQLDRGGERVARSQREGCPFRRGQRPRAPLLDVTFVRL